MSFHRCHRQSLWCLHVIWDVFSGHQDRGTSGHTAHKASFALLFASFLPRWGFPHWFYVVKHVVSGLHSGWIPRHTYHIWRCIIRQRRSRHLNSRVRTLASVDLPVSLQHLNSQKSVTAKVASKRFLTAVLPNRMWSQMISTGKPLVTCLNFETLRLGRFWMVKDTYTYLALKRFQSLMDFRFVTPFLGVLFESLYGDDYLLDYCFRVLFCSDKRQSNNNLVLKNGSLNYTTRNRFEKTKLV